jgi:hypothetical protein
MFGKSISEYLAFQKVPLLILAAVGLARLGLSLAGVADGTVKWVSLNAVAWPTMIYYGVAAHRAGFRYKQLLPVAFLQALTFHIVPVLGILLTIAGMPNIYAAPEYGGPAGTNQWLHAGAHLTLGLLAVTLITWGVSSLALLVTRKMSSRPTAAAAA